MKIDKKVREKLREQLVRSLQQANKQTVHITAPYELNQSQLEYFKQELKVPDSVHIETVIDESLLGGFIIQYGSNIIDTSVRTRVNNLVAKLENTL